MNVTCPQCATVFRVDPAKVPERGVRARCSVCAGLIAVRRPAVAAPASPRMTSPAVEPIARPPSPLLESAPIHGSPPAPTPAPVPVPAPAPPASPPAPTPVAAPAPATPAPIPAPQVTEPVRSAPPVVPEPVIMPTSPPAVPFAALPVEAPAGGDSKAPSAPATRSFTNPFLQQDPGTRARRLARALISDLVVYHPEKRQRGLADGNLKELFAEEIRKSWEEYSEQVGEEIASSTSFFTEALNEILSEGRQLFG